MESRFPCHPGTYALIFQNSAPASIQAGALGCLVVEPGWYIYVGSAFGPGGLRGRMRHHLNDRPAHWHVDALKQAAALRAVWFCADRRRLEHIWAQAWLEFPATSAPWQGFGASDCHCRAHLFRRFRRPNRQRFAARLKLLYPELELLEVILPAS
jgi:Uri superfamily endonuclease